MNTPLTSAKLLELLEKLPNPREIPGEIRAGTRTYRALMAQHCEAIAQMPFGWGLEIVLDAHVDPDMCEVWTVWQVNDRRERGLTAKEYRTHILEKE